MTLCDENYKINKVLCCNYLNLCYVFHDVRNLICFANTDLGIEIIFSFQRQKFVFWFLSGWVYSKSRNFINLVEQTCWAELIFWCMMCIIPILTQFRLSPLMFMLMGFLTEFLSICLVIEEEVLAHCQKCLSIHAPKLVTTLKKKKMSQ